MLNEIGKIEIQPVEKEFYFFDGKMGRTKGTVKIPFEYEGKEFCENFNIVENKKRKAILLCNNMVKTIECERAKKEIPVECCINTGNRDPVSWTRPIRSHKDKRILSFC